MVNGKRKVRIAFPKMKITMDMTHESDDEYNGEIWSINEVCPCYYFQIFDNFYFGLSLIINIKIFLIGQRSFRLASSER